MSSPFKELRIPKLDFGHIPQQTDWKLQSDKLELSLKDLQQKYQSLMKDHDLQNLKFLSLKQKNKALYDVTKIYEQKFLTLKRKYNKLKLNSSFEALNNSTEFTPEEQKVISSGFQRKNSFEKIKLAKGVKDHQLRGWVNRSAEKRSFICITEV